MRIICLSLVLVLLSLSSRSQCLQASVALTIDYSGSEDGNEPLLVGAAYEFVESLPISESEIRLSIITFNNWPYLWSTMTGSRDTLISALGRLSQFGSYGDTRLYGGLSDASMEFARDTREVIKILIIISDGEISDMTASIELLQEIKDTWATTVYAIQIGGGIEGYANLKRLAGDDGRVMISTARDLAQALKSLSLCP